MSLHIHTTGEFHPSRCWQNNCRLLKFLDNSFQFRKIFVSHPESIVATVQVEDGFRFVGLRFRAIQGVLDK